MLRRLHRVDAWVWRWHDDGRTVQAVVEQIRSGEAGSLCRRSVLVEVEQGVHLIRHAWDLRGLDVRAIVHVGYKAEPELVAACFRRVDLCAAARGDA